VMYATLGVLAALGGWAAGNLLSSPWFVIPLSLFFVALATSMFGLWEIRLPYWLQNRIANVGGKGFFGAFAMGLVGGVLIAPCTGPVLAGILGYVATTRNVVMGAALLFTYALGIGVLFWVLAMFAVSLPKGGAWMDAVKTIFGVALLAAALYYLQNVVMPLARYASGRWPFAALNAGLVVAGALVGGVHLTLEGGGLLRILRKLVGVLLLTVGIFGLVNYTLTPGTPLPWVHDEPAALARARKENRPVLVDFWALSCVPCRRIEAQILSHPTVRRELERFVLLKVDVDTDRGEQLKAKYRSTVLPELILLDAKGDERARTGKVGSIAEMLRLLEAAR
jgi:thiol:disulfide interchange protein DsbD